MMSKIETFVTFCYVSVIVLLGVCLYNMNYNLSAKNKFQVRNSCVLPPHPMSGWWTLPNQLTKPPNTAVPTGSTLLIFCNQTYKLDGSAKSLCIEGKWYPKIAKCLKTCPPMLSSSLMKIQCSFDNKIMKNCTDPIDNTQAQFFCAPYYEDERKVKFKAICNNGKWSEQVPQCVPVCGRRQSKKGMPVIANGTFSTKGEFPWQVALYQNRNNICGGILLHERLILTAAHCVSNADGNPNPTYIYIVIVGNHYRRYHVASLEDGAQSSSVHAIYVPDGYAGGDRFYYIDIAIIVTTKTFKLSSTVQPVCIDWSTEYERLLYKTGRPMGLVSGWGYTIEHSKPSDMSRSLELSIIDREKCIHMLDDVEHQGYVTDDKICGGYLNKSKSVRHGDSGSGVVFNHKGRHYLIGIVSISLLAQTENGSRDSQKYSLFTQVSKYIDDFIWEYYARYKPQAIPLVYTTAPTTHIHTQTSTSMETSTTTPTTPAANSTNCLLTKQPEFGQWAIYRGTSNSSPGTFVKTGTMLKIVCHEGYKLDGNDILACENGTWSSDIGNCLKMCPTIASTKVMNITCYFNIRKLKNCAEPVVGTIAKYHCAPFYEDVKLMEHSLYCNGSWGNASWTPGTPYCVPKCGHRSVKDPVLNISDGTRDFPWVVGIYRQNDNKLICTGTLLSDKIVLTVARCLGDVNEKLLSKQYIVAAGSYFSSRSSEKVQTSSIHHADNYGYLLIIVLENEFQFSRTVQPVCIDWEGELTKENDEGYLSLWNSNGTSINFSHNSTTAKVKLASIEECRMNLPEEYMNMTNEKLCVHHSERGAPFCAMDGGGGLFVKYQDKFHIFGVMDVLNTQEECVNREYSLYIPVNYYLTMFKTKLKN
ncbi:uncharacterized protein LOC135142584 isoform X2 [Zophobas morio]|uniref:uncharacterized protein LOC135142584 isoform X2 n=1 Tax=Zophobas morio TaxID=2755281 RepID=UPI0030837A2D